MCKTTGQYAYIQEIRKDFEARTGKEVYNLDDRLTSYINDYVFYLEDLLYDKS